jgi:hypothetical protein
MTVITKAQGKTDLQHVLTNIIEDKEDDGTSGPIELALLNEGVNSILDLNTISEDDLDTLKYDVIDSNNATITKTLHKSQIGLLKSFRAYVCHKDIKGEIIDSFDKWDQLDLGKFQASRSSKEWCAISANPASAYPSGPGSGNKHTKDLVADFKKGIKRDANMFPTLKQDKQWDNWQRTVITQARAQDLNDVLDPNFTPIGIEDANLFHERQHLIPTCHRVLVFPYQICKVCYTSRYSWLYESYRK